MFEVATLTPNRMVELPDEIAKHFQPADQFIVWVEGDTVHLKRIVTFAVAGCGTNGGR